MESENRLQSAQFSVVFPLYCGIVQSLLLLPVILAPATACCLRLAAFFLLKLLSPLTVATAKIDRPPHLLHRVVFRYFVPYLSWYSTTCTSCDVRARLCVQVTGRTMCSREKKFAFEGRQHLHIVAMGRGTEILMTA